MTVAVEIGRTATGEPAPPDLEELLATRLLVQGNSGSGKSHLLRRLFEQNAPWVEQAIVDPEGGFATLAEQYGSPGHRCAGAHRARPAGGGRACAVHRVATIAAPRQANARNRACWFVSSTAWAADA